MSMVDDLKVAFGTSYGFYLKAHNFHWNVEGELFYNFHNFFGGIYEEVYGSIDATAEQIRTLDAYTPGSFSRLKELSTIADEERVELHPINMVEILAKDNKRVLAALNTAFKSAEEAGNQGLMDHLAGRIDAHNKHQWMLNSHLKKINKKI